MRAIVKGVKLGLLAVSAGLLLTAGSCQSTGGGAADVAQQEPRVPKPLSTDTNEVKWRMYYEDQFTALGNAVPPGAADADVAWTAYYAEKQAHAIAVNNRLLAESLKLAEEERLAAESGR